MAGSSVAYFKLFRQQRSKIKISMKFRQGLMVCCLLCCVLKAQAQYSMGNTGQLNIPTADMQEAGTFMGGGNYLPDGMTPFNFNTGNYFVNMTFLSFVELSYRCTLLKTRRYDGKRGYFQQDRSMTARIRPLKEGKYRPSLVIGVDDPFKIPEQTICHCLRRSYQRLLHCPR